MYHLLYYHKSYHLGIGEGRVILDPMSGVTSGRISRNVALDWGKERLLLTIELSNSSKCHPGPGKRLVPSQLSREDGRPKVCGPHGPGGAPT